MNCRLLFVNLFLVSSVLGHADLKDQWAKWKKKYGQKFAAEEDRIRFHIWKKNHELVQNHNVKFESGEGTYTMGMNSMAAMTKEEFRKMLMPKYTASVNVSSSAMNFLGRSNLPESVDWRDDYYVTPVKNQGQLGSCYSFSAVGAVEGQYSKNTGNLVSFSEKQVVDCDQGGDGGFPFKVFKYLIQCGGVETENAYPYEDQVGRCRFDLDNVAAVLSDYKFVFPFGDEYALKSAVASVGPISVSSIKVFPSFQFYKSGIYYESKCNEPELEGVGYHAMLATGYGADADGKDYWMVKNSWGTDWGEGGYIRMARNEDDNCGIADQPSYPIMFLKQPKVSQSDVIKDSSGGQGGRGFSTVPTTSLIIIGCFVASLMKFF